MPVADEQEQQGQIRNLGPRKRAAGQLLFSMPTTLQPYREIHSYIHTHTHTAKVEREKREGEREERQTHLNFL